MGMAAWILFCILASVGLVQCGFWAMEAFGGQNRPLPMYHIVPLYDEPEQIEACARSALASMRRRGIDEAVLLVDMGIGEECREICDRLVCEEPGAYICEKERIPEVIEELEGQRR